MVRTRKTKNLEGVVKSLNETVQKLKERLDKSEIQELDQDEIRIDGHSTKRESISNQQPQPSNQGIKKRVPVITESRTLTKPLTIKRTEQWQEAANYDFRKEMNDGDILLHDHPQTSDTSIRDENITFLTKDEKVWRLDRLKAQVFLENIEKTEQLQAKEAEWIKTTANWIRWAKTRIQDEKTAAARIELIESIPQINDKNLIRDLERELGLKRNDNGHWQNSIINYIAKDVQLWDDTLEPDEIANSTQVFSKQQNKKSQEQYVRTDNYSAHLGYQTAQQQQYTTYQPAPQQYNKTYQPPQQQCGTEYQQRQQYHRPQYQSQYQTYRPDYLSDYHGQTNYPITISQSHRENSMKKIADKIHLMETLIRVKGLRFTKSSQPKQWIKKLTDVCREQKFDFEDRLELLKIAINEEEWINQNCDLWSNWEEVERSFKVTFCKTMKDTDVLQELFNTYQRKNEDTQEFIRNMRTRFKELDRPLGLKGELDILIPKLTAEMQTELNTMPVISSYTQLAEAIATAERRLADKRKARDVNRSTVRRLQNTRDSISETDTDSQSGEEKRVQRLVRKKRHLRKPAIKNSPEQEIHSDKSNDKKINVVFDKRNNNRHRDRSNSNDRNKRSGSNTSRSSTRTVGGTYICLNCGERGGHRSRDCRNERVNICVNCLKVGETVKTCSCIKN
ncbi:uncharacterized protein LOC130670457 [Microplitis mediator]|uniref:uncharacterized protein LOC130664876 n=1 Tax=Microplitis mediator TaxID=375433 RepID=UPI00255580BF|nr:uncharacterized protein LOC130664876 [Microplitis mediator]XP_057329848.1 uncharacterized protein LOC130670457 [Microplitis mediator]